MILQYYHVHLLLAVFLFRGVGWCRILAKSPLLGRTLLHSASSPAGSFTPSFSQMLCINSTFLVTFVCIHINPSIANVLLNIIVVCITYYSLRTAYVIKMELDCYSAPPCPHTNISCVFNNLTWLVCGALEFASSGSRFPAI